MTLTPANTTELFRFALLLTGDAETAVNVLTEAVAQIPDEFTQMRGERARTVWLLRNIRERAGMALGKARPPADETPPENEDEDVAAFQSLMKNLGGDSNSTKLPEHFAALPEPDRSVLALFYLDLLDLREMTQFFDSDLELLSGQLATARKYLREALAR